MKRKICVLTATRAEYGLLKPIIKKLCKEDFVDVKIVVTGAHLSPEFGLTYKEIEDDGVNIDKKIDILLSSDTPAAISKTMGLAMISFAEYFSESKPEALIVLGDRYETLAVGCAAMNERIPIFHLYGGETTEGAVDESIRHAITKMSYLHFTSTDTYRNRVIQLGENPERVFNVGAIGIENAKNIALLDKNELEKNINFNLDTDYAVVTFHPVTLNDSQSEKQFKEILLAFDQFKDMRFIFTKANADADGRIINSMIDNYVSENKNAIAFESLGTLRYLSALKYSSMVIGNSSSAIIEAPSFKIPIINIGERQKGRIEVSSIINCSPIKNEIIKAMNLALTKEFRKQSQKIISPYGDGNTSNKIVEKIKEFLLNKKIDLKKKFYDIEVF